MSRLIDADAFKKVIREKLPLGLFMKRTIQSAVKTMGELVEELEKAPTIDQWHYPAKGELPEKDVECLVRTTSGNNFIAMIDSSDKCWCTGEFFGEYLSDDCVACWRYIIPPKEEA